ncbi:MAG: RhuM family protein [Verrucomicrobiia bacterium]
MDVILAVGYRTNSARAIDFRKWATKILKDYLLKGYAVNEKRLIQAQNQLKELQGAISFLQEKVQHESLAGQEQEILNLLSSYAKTLTLLEQYDKEKLTIARKGKDRFVLDYETARKIINDVKK